MIFFAACKLSVCTLFLQIALKWKVYALKWSELNKNFKTLKIVDVKAKQTETRILTWFIAFMLSINISYLSYLFKSFGIIPSCTPERHGELPSNEYIFYNLFSEYANIIPYNLFLGIHSLYVDYALSAGGVLIESLIVILSLMLARRFELFNEKLSMNVNVSRKIFILKIVTKHWVY